MLCYFICDYCFDYVMMLYEMVWIVEMVGYVYGMVVLIDFVVLFVGVGCSEGEMVGICDVMFGFFRMICCVVVIDVLVFIFGELGMGKELMVVVIYECLLCV